VFVITQGYLTNLAVTQGYAGVFVPPTPPAPPAPGVPTLPLTSLLAPQVFVGVEPVELYKRRMQRQMDVAIAVALLILGDES
jgi:hypothetical protein